MSNVLQRLSYGWKRRTAARRKAQELDRLREQMQIDAAQLREEETSLDTRASIVVVAGGVIITAIIGLGVGNTATYAAAIIAAAAAVLIAIVSLALGRRPERTPVYSIRPWQLNDPAGYAASVMDQIQASQHAARRRRSALTGAYAGIALATVSLAANALAFLV